MKIHRFYLAQPLGKKVLITEPELVHQLTRVLRFAPGERLVLFNGDGQEWRGRIADIRKDAVEAEMEESRRNEREPETGVTLYAAVLKRENFEWITEKATEVGVRRIVPVLTERTIKLKLSRERLGKIAKEAAEQSGRAVIPEITEPIDLMEALKEARGMKLILDPDGGKFGKAKETSIFVGPEGGWTEAEMAAAEESGCERVSLGSTVLRAETAAILGVHRALNP